MSQAAYHKNWRMSALKLCTNASILVTPLYSATRLQTEAFAKEKAENVAGTIFLLWDALAFRIVKNEAMN